MTATRCFTSAALRAHEEVPAEAAAWLPRSIVVEYEGGEPVCGVWRSVDGRRRVCWYASAVTPAVIAAHAERYGNEAFWVIDRSARAARSGARGERVRRGGAGAGDEDADVR
jgi:hypothetical protein